MTERPKNKLYEAITNLVGDRLKLGFQERSLNRTTCTEIYQMIFETVTEVLTGSSLKLTNEFANYVSQDLYDVVLINGRQILDPNIFSQRAKLENLDQTELMFMMVFFNGTPHSQPVVDEVRRRS